MTSLNILIIGKTGQLARALKSRETLALHITNITREQLNLSWDKDSIHKALRQLSKPDLIINAAAYTAVDKAETDSDVAFQVNGNAPGFIANFCAKHNIPFIHISTDYVFNGQSQSPYKVDAETDPLGVYGHSKLAGERAVQAAGGQAAIIRTSWVYDGRGNNFFTTMLRLATMQKELGIVSDQYGRPSYAGHLADATLCMAKALISGRKSTSGIFHVSNSGQIIHWADFAKAIFKQAGQHIEHDITVNEITTERYPTPAKRPAYSALDLSKFEHEFGINLPDWQLGLKEAFKEWQAAN